MSRQARRKVSRKYFSGERLTEHHSRPFNALLERGMMDVVGEKATIETDIGDKEGGESIYVELDDVHMETPRIREADGSEELLLSQEARLYNTTCSAPVLMEMSVVRGGEEEEEVVVDTAETEVGWMPIMVSSLKCSITKLSDENLVGIGEDPIDLDGYFIVNGSECMLITSGGLMPNKTLTGYDTKCGDEIQVAKIFSQRCGYRAFILYERNREGPLEVSLPSVSRSINSVTLVRVFGPEPGEEIVHRVLDDPKIMKFMLENLEEVEAQIQEQVIKALGKRVTGGQGKNHQLKRVNYVTDRYLLPHLHEGGAEEGGMCMNKAYYLRRMAEACFELAPRRRDPDDKGHYTNKRLEVSGDFTKDLFRTALNKLTRGVKYQLERANVWSRNLTVNIVVRSNVLTERPEHPITTGNWVGGHSGISQLVDRTDYTDVLSYLRRLHSPLSRLQPHFRARNLHAIQWGRICPLEAPEGPNCRLVKSFAQAVELSRNIEDEQSLERELTSMGAEGIPGIDSVDAAPADD